MLTEEERKFLSSRDKFCRSWPFVGSMMIFGWAVFIFWIVLRVPLLGNPYYVLKQIQYGFLGEPEKQLLAGMCPMLFALVGVIVLLFLFIGFSWNEQEKRLLNMVDRVANSNRAYTGAPSTKGDHKKNPLDELI